MNVFTTIAECRKVVRSARQSGETIGLVPTMGALHDGHLSLIRAARRRCRRVAVTIFVNPTQFAAGEDFDAYPRMLDDDLRKCEAAGTDFVFAPGVQTMYDEDPKTTVHVAGLTDGLCGPHRPGHFDGVATVVNKLFNILPADAAFFGEKDFQQLMVIRRMVRDLNIPIEIVGCPTVRETDGLAMSSRNAYLSPDHRRQATSLSRAMFAAHDCIAQGERNVAALVAELRKTILSDGPANIDYIEIVDAESLEPLSAVDRPARICLAVRIGATRLIDNVAVDAPPA
jgi:pantoate--beta-alanine ligase